MEHEIIRRINGGLLKGVKTKLNKCPKCGGGGAFVQETFYVFGVVPIKTYHVQCLRCPNKSVSVPAETKGAKEKAVEYWNAGTDYYSDLEEKQAKWKNSAAELDQFSTLQQNRA